MHNCVLSLVGIAAAFVLRQLLVRANARLDRGEMAEEHHRGMTGPEQDTTTTFRYLY